MEHRVILTQKEAYGLFQKLEIEECGFVKDTYTGNKRIRVDSAGNFEEKDYLTAVSGTILRFSSKCKLGLIKDIYFEVKWTEDKIRFEVEFEGKVPDEYKDRPNIRGWDILKGD